MKTYILPLSLSAALLAGCSSSYLAHNNDYDGVYDPGGDHLINTHAHREEQEEEPMANFDYVDPNFDPNHINPYEYSSRIRRFHNDANFGYYDPYYTNMGWYDPSPWNYGTSLYYDDWMYNNYHNGWTGNAGWNSYNGWYWGGGYSGWGGANWAYGPNRYNPWYGYNSWNNPWYNPWSSWRNCPGYYNSYDMLSQTVYAPRGQNRPGSAEYTRNAYEGAIRRATVDPPSTSEHVVSGTDRTAIPHRTVRNNEPTNTMIGMDRTEVQKFPVQVDRNATKPESGELEVRDVQMRPNTYYRQDTDLLNPVETSTLDENKGHHYDRENSDHSWNSDSPPVRSGIHIISSGVRSSSSSSGSSHSIRSSSGSSRSSNGIRSNSSSSRSSGIRSSSGSSRSSSGIRSSSGSSHSSNDIRSNSGSSHSSSGIRSSSSSSRSSSGVRSSSGSSRSSSGIRSSSGSSRSSSGVRSSSGSSRSSSGIRSSSGSSRSSSGIRSSSSSSRSSSSSSRRGGRR